MESQRTYPLNVELCEIAFRVDEVVVNTTFIDLLQLSLVVVQIGLSK